MPTLDNLAFRFMWLARKPSKPYQSLTRPVSPLPQEADIETHGKSFGLIQVLGLDCERDAIDTDALLVETPVFPRFIPRQMPGGWQTSKILMSSQLQRLAVLDGARTSDTAIMAWREEKRLASGCTWSVASLWLKLRNTRGRCFLQTRHTRLALKVEAISEL